MSNVTAIAVFAVALLLSTIAVSNLKAVALEWWQPTFHKENRTAEQIAADEQEKKEFLANLSRLDVEIKCLGKHEGDPNINQICLGLPTVEEQLANQRAINEEFENCKIEIPPGIVYQENILKACRAGNTTMTAEEAIAGHEEEFNTTK